ncbi:MAG: SagB/ThcOx family dehydrogenase [Oscillospiraceae bacterium]|nr:SagB/ThcOx family dehydrogenase [Oscillospiraceae bacterium]
MLDEKLQEELIQNGRSFCRGVRSDDPYLGQFESDQEMGLPQPPLTKAPVTLEEKWIRLPMDYNGLPATTLHKICLQRRSHRAYERRSISLLELSYLLWTTQGITGIRGKQYATLRPVPSGGARHPFETYLLVNHVEGLAGGIYHYLPAENALEPLGDLENWDDTVTALLHGQRWAAQSGVIFLWSLVPYRAEWRYGIYAHRTALIDVGHVGQNLYLATTELGLGTCAVAAFDGALCGKLLGLNDGEEFVIYSAPVGTVLRQDG